MSSIEKTAGNVAKQVKKRVTPRRKKSAQKPKAKIGLVCPYNIGLGGGVQECVLASRAELIKRGYDAHIITPLSKEAKENPPKGTILVGSGADIRSPFATTAQVSASINSDELQAIVDEENFDILHFHEPWVPVMSRQLLAKSNSINIATFHARMPEGFMTKTFEKMITPYTKSILKYIDSFVAVSDPAAYYIRSLTDEDVRIIPNGIDLKKYRYVKKKKATTKSKRTIFYVGRLEGRKGVKYLIDAFSQLNDTKTRLIIGGDGPERNKLENYADEYPELEIKFLGHISEKQKIRYLHEADLFVSPAIYGESFGIVLLEAMACGTPIVAGNNAGYASVMQGRGLISLVDPKDIGQFARRLALLLYDAELDKLWRKWALEYVKQYDYTKVIDKYESLYKELLKNRNR